MTFPRGKEFRPAPGSFLFPSPDPHVVDDGVAGNGETQEALRRMGDPRRGELHDVRSVKLDPDRVAGNRHEDLVPLTDPGLAFDRLFLSDESFLLFFGQGVFASRASRMSRRMFRSSDPGRRPSWDSRAPRRGGRRGPPCIRDRRSSTRVRPSDRRGGSASRPRRR